MYYGFGYDATILLLIPAMLFAFYAQSRISSTFNKYLRVRNSNGYTGYQIARRILDSEGLENVHIEMAQGRLTDHYDPRARVLRLSNEVYNGSSLASAGVAAHECGHAIQHQEEYAPLAVRNTIAPVAMFGSRASMFFILAGFLFGAMRLFEVGILLFAVAVAFQIITLPVEFDASKRAISLLESHNLVATEEIAPAKKVLNAAALTYIAATLVAITQLARLLILRNSRRD